MHDVVPLGSTTHSSLQIAPRWPANREHQPRKGHHLPNLIIRTRADSPEISRAAGVIEHAAWNPLSFLNYTQAHYDHYVEILETYADYQMCLIDVDKGYPMVSANCVPMHVGDDEDLPAEGWDWIVERAAEGTRRGKFNTLGLLAISVPLAYRSMGYASLMIRAFLDQAAARKLPRVVGPVRPSAKASHPRVPIREYITWTDAFGRPFDPWLRAHLGCGSTLVGPCDRSMVVEEHIGFWETWSGQRFKKSGFYEVPGALVPIEIDLEHRVGRYQEPNVWVNYTIKID